MLSVEARGVHILSGRIDIEDIVGQFWPENGAARSEVEAEGGVESDGNG